MTPVAPPAEPWMPNGFPPPSFVVETERIRTFAGTRGRWLAAAAILGVLLLIAGVLLIANQKDNKTALKSGSTSTTALGDTATVPGSTVLDPTATLPSATIPPGGVGDPSLPAPGVGGPVGGTGTTVGGVVAPGPTPAPVPGAAPGALSTTASAVTIPKVDSTVGPQSNKVTLRNTGGSPVNYTSQSQFPNSLTIDKPTGTLAPGASVDLTVTLNGISLPEGSFTGQVGFDGAGSPRVTVNSTVGRPPVISDNAGEQCAPEGPTCSKQIKLEPANPTPPPTVCNTSWRYRVSVSDESHINAVRALTPTNVELKIGGVPNGGNGTWESDIQAAVHGTLKFTIEAVDQFGYAHKTADQTITCP